MATKCVESDLAENKELGKKGWGEVQMGCTSYDTDLVVVTWFVKMKCVELDLAKNQELEKKGCGEVRLSDPVYDEDLVVGDLVY